MTRIPDPQLVLGSAQFGSAYGINNSVGQPSDEMIQQILRTAYSYQIHEIDTAQAYGNSESVLGRILPLVQNPFLVVHSKFVLDGTKTIPDLLKESLSRLRLDRLGYFYFHKFSDFLIAKALNVKEQSFVENYSLGLAVSLYDEAELEVVLRSRNIRAIQIPINIFDKSSSKLRLLLSARDQGIKIYARSVFLQGVFFLDPNKLPSRLDGLRDPLLKLDQISKELDISKMELALGFVKSLDIADGILIGVECEEQLKRNVLAWSNPLPAAAISALDSVEVKIVELLKPMNWN